MTRDYFTLGVVTALIAKTIINGLEFLFYTAQITEHPIWHLASSVYLPIQQSETLIGQTIGLTTDYAVATALGLILIYILYQTGKDYFYLKGLTIGLFAWLFIFGVILRTGIARLEPLDPTTNLFQMFTHLLLGLLMSWFMVKISPASD